MKVTPLKIPDIKLIEPEVFDDSRGFFYESFNQKKFNEAIGQDISFVQDNHSKSQKGVLRGLHFQEEPHAQGKLVRVIVGEVFDVVVDIRINSKSYGHWVAEILSAENKKQLWIPKGFAHGFLTLSNNAEFLYKTTDYWKKDYEHSIHWKNNNFNIEWPTINGEIVISKKDS